MAFIYGYITYIPSGFTWFFSMYCPEMRHWKWYQKIPLFNIWSLLISMMRQSTGSFFLLVIHRHVINTLRPRQNGRVLADDIFKCIFLNENVSGLAEIPLKYVPECRIDDKQALVQIMAWRRSGDKPLSKPMMVILLTHICVIRPQCVNWKYKQHPGTFLGSLTSYEYICM